jgi:hypothetical protein
MSIKVKFHALRAPGWIRGQFHAPGNMGCIIIFYESMTTKKRKTGSSTQESNLKSAKLENQEEM